MTKPLSVLPNIEAAQSMAAFVKEKYNIKDRKAKLIKIYETYLTFSPEEKQYFLEFWRTKVMPQAEGWMKEYLEKVYAVFEEASKEENYE